jgi:hypothetical protein
MTAAPEGTVTISCPTLDGGMLSVTLTSDPGTGAFAAEAIRCFGAQATGQVCVGDVRGSHYFTMTPGDVIADTQLAAAGITNRSQVQSISLAMV